MISEEDQGYDSKVGIILNSTVLYNAMIHPFTRMAIKGVLWYQGRNLYCTIKNYTKLL